MENQQQTEIETGNRLICEFDGWEFIIKPDEFGGELLAYKDGELRFRGEKPSYLETFLTVGFKFHSSWDALMPVLDKLRGLLTRYVFVQNSHATILRGSNGKSSFDISREGTTVKEAFECFVEAITWYNQNKN